MPDICDPSHEAECARLFERVCVVLCMPGFAMRPLRRRVRGRGKFRSYALGYTKLDSKTITIDLYTPRTMKTRKLDAILRVICHELTHHQEPPKLYRSWLRLIRRSHHPAFWKKYKENVERLATDEVLAKHFESR